MCRTPRWAACIYCQIQSWANSPHLTAWWSTVVGCNSLDDASRLKQVHVVFRSNMLTEILVMLHLFQIKVQAVWPWLRRQLLHDNLDSMQSEVGWTFWLNRTAGVYNQFCSTLAINVGACEASSRSKSLTQVCHQCLWAVQMGRSASPQTSLKSIDEHNTKHQNVWQDENLSTPWLPSWCPAVPAVPCP